MDEKRINEIRARCAVANKKPVRYIPTADEWLINALRDIKDLLAENERLQKESDAKQKQIDRLLSGDEIESDRLTSQDDKLIAALAEVERLRVEENAMTEIARQYHDERDTARQLARDAVEALSAVVPVSPWQQRTGREIELADLQKRLEELG